MNYLIDDIINSTIRASDGFTCPPTTCEPECKPECFEEWDDLEEKWDDLHEYLVGMGCPLEGGTLMRPGEHECIPLYVVSLEVLSSIHIRKYST